MNVRNYQLSRKENRAYEQPSPYKDVSKSPHLSCGKPLAHPSGTRPLSD